MNSNFTTKLYLKCSLIRKQIKYKKQVQDNKRSFYLASTFIDSPSIATRHLAQNGYRENCLILIRHWSKSLLKKRKRKDAKRRAQLRSESRRKAATPANRCQHRRPKILLQRREILLTEQPSEKKENTFIDIWQSRKSYFMLCMLFYSRLCDLLKHSSTTEQEDANELRIILILFVFRTALSIYISSSFEIFLISFCDPNLL